MTVELAHDIQGDGPLLVLVHGITENRHAWDPVNADLATDHRVLRVDLRGHGESPHAETYAITELAADVAALVDGPALVVGHSLGGAVATAYAAQRADTRGVINVDQTLDLAELQSAVLAQEPLLRGPEFPAVIAALFDSMRGQASDEEWARLTALRRPDQEVVLGVWSIMLDTTPAELSAAIDAIASGVRCPYLALDGADPGPGHAQWLAERIPQAELEVWDGAGHYPHLVDPPRFLARVRAFEATL